MRPAALSVALVLLVAGSAHADLYKYVDKDGRTTYSDQPPPASARAVERKTLFDSVVDTDKLPFATQAAARKYPVTLFANGCGEPCTLAKALLGKRGIPFQLRNPETSIEDADALKKLVGALQVPALLVGNSTPLRGYEEESWNKALDAAGYPRSTTGVRTDTAKEAESRASKSAADRSAGAKVGQPAAPSAAPAGNTPAAAASPPAPPAPGDRPVNGGTAAPVAVQDTSPGAGVSGEGQASARAGR